MTKAAIHLEPSITWSHGGDLHRGAVGGDAERDRCGGCEVLRRAYAVEGRLAIAIAGAITALFLLIYNIVAVRYGTRHSNGPY